VRPQTGSLDAKQAGDTGQDARFAAVVAALGGTPGVSLPASAPQAGARRKGPFGSAALKVQDKIFAMLVGGRFVVKLPKSRVDALVEAGDGERFTSGAGRPMKEWLSVNPVSDQDWLQLAQEALEYVGRISSPAPDG
jgi:hypothetical protein